MEIKSILNTAYTHAHNCSCDACKLPSLADNTELGDTSELATISADLAKTIYDARAMPEAVPDSLIQQYATRLYAAVLTGLEDADALDSGLRKSLETNVYQFSAAKSYTQMKSLTQALLDADGKLRTWADFRNIALEINNEQVNQWLEAEYQNAIACSQMAGKWVHMESRSRALPYLQYVTAHDDRVRPAHAAMDGTVRRIDDAYWNSYYPPNGWGCRCTVKQLGADAKVTEPQDLYYPTDKEVPPIFRFNPGKERMAFSSDHPYFKDTPKQVLEQGKDLMHAS